MRFVQKECDEWRCLRVGPGARVSRQRVRADRRARLVRHRRPRGERRLRRTAERPAGASRGARPRQHRPGRLLQPDRVRPAHHRGRRQPPSRGTGWCRRSWPAATRLSIAVTEPEAGLGRGIAARRRPSRRRQVRRAAARRRSARRPGCPDTAHPAVRAHRSRREEAARDQHAAARPDGSRASPCAGCRRSGATSPASTRCSSTMSRCPSRTSSGRRTRAGGSSARSCRSSG